MANPLHHIPPNNPSYKQDLSTEEKQAFDSIQEESAASGSTLANGGKGGLPPSLVLGLFRRDGWQCKKCSTNQELTLHHKADMKNLISPKWKNRGITNDSNALVTLCKSCHENLHKLDESM